MLLVLQAGACLFLCPTNVVLSSLRSFFALAAARALVDIPDLSAEEVARKAMEIAADMCVYTNTNFRSEVIDAKEVEEKK